MLFILDWKRLNLWFVHIMFKEEEKLIWSAVVRYYYGELLWIKLFTSSDTTSYHTLYAFTLKYSVNLYDST